jgi:predicted nucleotidyltransferase
VTISPALTKLKSLEPSLRAQGVCGLHMFGSQARGDAEAAADVDLMFDLAPGARFSLFDQARIARQLSEELQARVDFVPRRSLHPLVAARAESERVTIFN